MSVSIISVKGHDTKCSDISYDELSNNIITVGDDGIVKIWSALTDNLVKSFSVTKNINSMVYEKDRIFIASSLSFIESYCTSNIKNSAVLAQFLVEVNHMRLSKDKSYLVACSSDNTVKVLQFSLSDDKEYREILLNGHDGPVMSVDIDADCTLVASAGCDGNVIIWRARDGVQMTKLPILDEIKDITKIANKCRLRFSPSSDPILAVPLLDKISLIDCDDWSVRGSLIWDQVCNGLINECIFTDDGCFLIAGTSDGHIIVWNIETLTLVASWLSSRGTAITGMLWYPKKDKTILFSDASGYWEATKLDFRKKEKNKDKLTMEELDEMFDDFAEEDMDGVDDVDKASLASTVKRDSEQGSDMEDEFNISLIKAEFDKKIDDTPLIAPEPIQPQMFAKKTVHPPVRPGATPISSGMQLLLWNSVGALRKHYDDDGNTDSVEVYFHDCNLLRSIIVKPDIIDCDMGDLNTSAILLVSDQETEEDDMEDDEVVKQSMVYVQSVNNAWPIWKVLLPKGESPVACCLAGDEYAVVLSDNGFMRYFSLRICGMQSGVESIRGVPVSMASSCYDPENSIGYPRVVVVVEDEGRLLWRLEELRPGQLLVSQGQMSGSITTDWHPLPLSAESRLTWIGFSDSGAVYTVDSKQNVRRLQITLNRDTQQFSVPRWFPVLNLKQALDKKCRNVDRYFPVGFTDCGGQVHGAMSLRCTNSRYPTLVPWPHLSVVPFKAPLCQSQDGTTTALEASYAQLHTVSDWIQDGETLAETEKTLLLQLFFNAINQNADVRALSIARLMPNSSVVQVAIRAAVRLRKKVLAEQLGKLALSMDEEMSIGKRRIKHYDEDETEDKENDGDEDEGGDNEEEEEEEMDGSEEEEEESVEAHPVESGMKKVPSVVNVDKLLNGGSSPVRETLSERETTKGSPFRVVTKKGTMVGRGITVIDRIGLAASAAKKAAGSPKKDAMTFGNFVPSPSTKTFMIKQKRKSTVKGSSGPGKKQKR